MGITCVSSLLGGIFHFLMCGLKRSSPHSVCSEWIEAEKQWKGGWKKEWITLFMWLLPFNGRDFLVRRVNLSSKEKEKSSVAVQCSQHLFMICKNKTKNPRLSIRLTKYLLCKITLWHQFRNMWTLRVSFYIQSQLNIKGMNKNLTGPQVYSHTFVSVRLFFDTMRWHEHASVLTMPIVKQLLIVK